MFVMLWSVHPELEMLECSLLKSCMCAILQVYFGEKKMMIIKDIHIWSLYVFCGLFVFKQPIKQKGGEGKERKIFF